MPISKGTKDIQIESEMNTDKVQNIESVPENKGDTKKRGSCCVIF